MSRFSYSVSYRLQYLGKRVKRFAVQRKIGEFFEMRQIGDRKNPTLEHRGNDTETFRQDQKNRIDFSFNFSFGLPLGFPSSFALGFTPSGASILKLDVGVIIDHFIKFNQKKRGIRGISEYTEMKKGRNIRN